MMEEIVHADESNDWVEVRPGYFVRAKVRAITPLDPNYLREQDSLTNTHMRLLRTGWPPVYGEMRNARPELRSTPMLTQAEEAYIKREAARRYPYDWMATVRSAKQFGQACHNAALEIMRPRA